MQSTGVSGEIDKPPDSCFSVRNKAPALKKRGLHDRMPEGRPFASADWQWQMRHRLKTVAELQHALPGLTGTKAIEPVLAKYPMAITPYYLSLIRKSDSSDPIFRQCVPQPEELRSPVYCRPDPLGENAHSPVPCLIHRYEDRALSLSCSVCPAYCRHCTRKRMAGVREGFLTKSALARQVRYLQRHPEINEIIISGGDPFTMPTSRIEILLSAFRSVSTINIIRIGTRTPVTLPMRITDELCAALERYHPLWVCTHFNHPREITPESARACDKLSRSGVPILNQTVLLKDVNDSAETMIELCRALVSIRVRPYYLYQCDPVRGVEHFRTPLQRGVEIVEAVRSRMGGIGVPQFIVDAPDEGGKIPVSANSIVKMQNDYTLLRNRNGRMIVCHEPEAPGDEHANTERRGSTGKSKVALVYNLKKTPLSISDSDAEYDSAETVDTIARSIESLGHTVVSLEADSTLPRKLATSNVNVVFNIAESAGSRGREGHVPSLCEMMGLAYTGSDATTLALALDKALTKMVLLQNGIATPAFQLVRSPSEVKHLKLKYPMIVKPNHEGSSKGLMSDCVAENQQQVVALIERICNTYKQPAIVEEFLDGREFTVGLIGTGEPEQLPLLEILFLDPERPPVYDIELKQDPLDKVAHVCPGRVDEALVTKITALARHAFHTLSCRDICRVDVRLDNNGKPYVLEVNPLPGLAPHYSDICKMTEALGWSHPELISRLLAPALDRANSSVLEK